MRVDDSPAGFGLPEWISGPFSRPGEAVAAWLKQNAPALNSWLSELLQEQLTLVLAAAAWFGVVLVAYTLVRLGQKTFLAGRRLFIRLRISSIAFMAYLKGVSLTRLSAVLGAPSRHGVSHEEIELSDLDLVILKRGASLPPGFAISVVDIAQELRERPSRVERSLVRLRQHQLVDPLLGSTDGFNDYRLTDSGAWLVSRQRADEGPVL